MIEEALVMAKTGEQKIGECEKCKKRGARRD